MKYSQLSEEDQKKKAQKMMETFPGCIPILVLPQKGLPELKKECYLVKRDLNMMVLFSAVRRNIKLNSDSGMFLHVGHKVIMPNSSISSLYLDHAKNGFLIIYYGIENIFG